MNVTEITFEVSELIEHYNFYADNCTDDETPLTYKEWVREYREDLGAVMNSLDKG
jgi:hypothetical protein